MKKNTKAAIKTIPYILAFVITVLLVVHMFIAMYYFADGIPKYGYIFLLFLGLAGIVLIAYKARIEYLRDAK